MATRTIANAGGNWQTASTWVENAVPTAADDVVATASSGPLTLNSGTCSCRSADFTGYTNTLSHTSGVIWAIGDGSGGTLKLVPGMVYAPAAARAINFVSTTTGNQITCAGKTLGAVTFNGSGGAWTFQDTFAAGAVVTTAGNIDFGGRTVNVVSFTPSGTLARTLTITNSAITCSGGNGWNTNSSGITLTASSGSTITLSGSSAQFGMAAGQTVNNVVFSGGGTAAWNGNGTVNGNLTINGPPTCTVGAGPTVKGILTLGSTTLALKSVTGGTRKTIALSTTGSVTASNTTFTDIGFTGTNAPVIAQTTAGNVDGGNNSNILFHYYADTASGTLTLSGTDTESRSYTDTASGALTAVGATGEAQSHSPSPTGVLTLSGSETDALSFADTASGSLALSGTQLDELAFVDSQDGVLALTGSRDDEHEFADEPAGELALVGAASDALSGVDSPTGILALGGSTTDLWGFIWFDAAAGVISLDGKATEFRPYGGRVGHNSPSGEGTISRPRRGIVENPTTGVVE
jgi:hypothetical protein